jgi:hypothetical protein
MAGGTVIPTRPAGPRIELFTRAGCPRCAAARTFLAELARERTGLSVVEHDVGRDAAARARLMELAAAARVATVAVPAFAVGDALVVGYAGAETTGRRLMALLDAHDHARGPDAERQPNAGDACVLADGSPCPPVDEEATLDVPLLGPLVLRDVGLPLLTVVVGLLDGFNPCAMWMLLLLLSLLINVRDRRRMALVAGTFVAVSGLVYFAFMAAWLNAFLLVGLSRASELVLGTVALVVAAINVKDFFAFRRGISLAIPAGAKPGLYARTRRIVQADDLGTALVAVTMLALTVNVVEFLCTAGLPALYTRILTLRALPAWQYYAYLALYDLAYVADDALMVTIAVVTLQRMKLAERAGRWLKLVSGLVMLVLGAVLLLAPSLLVTPLRR